MNQETKYAARITYRDALGVQGVDYVAHDDQACFYAMFTGAVCGITLSHGVVTKAELRTPTTVVPDLPYEMEAI